MVKEHYRWDFIGLSTDDKPTPETSEKVVDGSTFYCSDTSKLYVFCQNDWYERKPLGEGGGGGSITPVQTTGTSTTDVMSQDATTKMIYPDIANNPTKISLGKSTINANKGIVINSAIETTSNNNIAISGDNDSPATIGSSAKTDNIIIGSDAYNNRGNYNVSIGANSNSTGTYDQAYNLTLGYASKANNHNRCVALGYGSVCNRDGEVNIGTGYDSAGGFNSTNYRVIGGVHDGQLANDAVTVGQINALIDAINTATGSSISHIGA